MPQGFKDWQTTIPALISCVFSFVLFKPQYFPLLVQDIALFAFMGGLAWLGIKAVSFKKE